MHLAQMSTTRRNLRNIRREMENDSSIANIKIEEAQFKSPLTSNEKKKPEREIKGIVVENTY